MNPTSLTRVLCTAMFAALGLISCIKTTQAQGIGINFAGGSRTLAATDQPGVVAGANWNNVIGGHGATLSGLLDTSGAATSAAVIVNSGGTYDFFTVPMTLNAATNKLYMGGLFGLGNGGIDTEVSITVNGIPYTTYDVYVYASTDTANNPVLSNTIGATTFYYGSDGTFGNSSATSLLLTTSTAPLNPTRGPAQYQLYSGLSGASFTLTTGGSITGIISNNVFGLHIVQRSPAAVITSTNPSTVPQGGPAFTLQVQGTGFLPGAKVRWNGADRPTTVVSPILLTVEIPASDLVARRSVGITVVNPGAAPSNEVAITIATPLIQISPTITRDRFTNEVVLNLMVTNRGIGFANTAELQEAALLTPPATALALPFPLGNLAPGAVVSATLRFPANTLSGTNILRIRGRYTDGIFSGTFRVIIP